MDEYLNHCICTKQGLKNLMITCEDEMLNQQMKQVLLKVFIIYSFYCYYCQLQSLLYVNILQPN